MVYSLTGYGRVEKKYLNYTLTVEIRSLNGRYFDMISKIHDSLYRYEDEIYKLVKEKCQRGLYNDEDGIAQLLRDLYIMVRNAKAFNQCNVNFQPWRFADMFEAALDYLYEQLSKLYSLPKLHLLAGRLITEENSSMQVCL